MGLHLVSKWPRVVKDIWLQLLFFYTQQWLRHFIEAPHFFLWSFGIVLAATVCCQECMNTSLSSAVMGIDENVNSSDWMVEWMDSIIVCTHGRRERERVSVWLGAVFQWLSINTVLSHVQRMYHNNILLQWFPTFLSHGLPPSFQMN